MEGFLHFNSATKPNTTCHEGSINYIADTPTIIWSGRMFYCDNGTYSELQIILQHVKSLLDLSAPSGFYSAREDAIVQLT